MEEEMVVRLAELDQRGRSNTRRIESLERSQELLQRLTVSVEVVVQEQQHLVRKMTELGSKLDTVERRPLRRWEAASEKLGLMLLSALLAWLLTRAGLG